MAQAVKSLASVEEVLNGWLKPKTFAESWDNVGLLVGSGKYSKEAKIISGILICNDLKPAVVEEAISKNANLVIAYHPPIFSGMKAIAYGSWKEELIARCLANDISVYSPHSCLDAVAGGMNDSVVRSLASFGSADASAASGAIIPSQFVDKSAAGWNFSSSFDNVSRLVMTLGLGSYDEVAFEIDADDKAKSASMKVYQKAGSSGQQIQQIRNLAEKSGVPEFKNPTTAHPAPFGAGRIVKFAQPVALSKVVDAVKNGLGLEYVQLAFGGRNEVQSAAICVGSGGSLLSGVPADVYITGEMSHHPILDCTFANTSVILCNHCSSERHYLPRLASIVKLLTNIDNVFVSMEDRTPLSLSN